MADEAQAVQFTVTQLLSWGLGIFLAFVAQGIGLVLAGAKYIGSRFRENTQMLDRHADKFERRIEELRLDMVKQFDKLRDSIVTTNTGHARLEEQVDGLRYRVGAVERRLSGGTRGGGSGSSTGNGAP